MIGLESLNYFLTKTIDIYEECLAESFSLINTPPMAIYLQKRGITSQELLKKYKVGYFDTYSKSSRAVEKFHELESEFSQLKPFLTQYSEARKEIPKELVKHVPCIYGPSGNYLMQRRIVFPIYSQEGRLLNIYGKSIEPDSPLPHVYGGANMCWYNLSSEDLATVNSLIITEGLFDVFTFLQTGIKNVTALCAGRYNYNHLHEQDVSFALRRSDLLKDLGQLTNLKTIYLCFDNDYSTHKYGSYMAVILARLLREHHFQIKIFRLPKDKDPNSLFTECSDSEQKRIQFFQEHFKELLDNAVDFVVEEALLLLDKLDLGEEDREKIGRMVENISYYYNDIHQGEMAV
ncbi:MAG: toprim domain-containing protein [Candidatus Scalindua sp.]